jgi:hypothetical protein
MSIPGIAQSDISQVQLVNQSSDYQKAQQYIQAIQQLPQSPTSQSPVSISPQPRLGGENEIFGLWITILYNGNEFEKQVEITPGLIRGKLTDPYYRTPVTFNIDEDPEDDVEAGFGFFRYGIDDGQTSHSAMANAFYFRQINNGVSNQYGYLEVWQEFRINLALFKAKGVHTDNFPLLTQIIGNIMEKIHQRFPAFYNFLSQFMIKLSPEPATASEDYMVSRIGYKSPPDEKIPLRFEKTFSIAKESLFRPFIFQHEMNPYDIIGTADNTISFGFEVYEAGNTDPKYDIGFDVDISPAAHTITQFTPREGKIKYYYHSASAEQTDITFSSVITKGGDEDERKEGTLSLTLGLESIPNELLGLGKWMSFDLDVIDDQNPLGGMFKYKASHQFNVGITVKAERFEEKVQVNRLPVFANLEWDVNFAVSNHDGFLKFDAEGFVELDMATSLDDIIIYYPKENTYDPDYEFLAISGIPSRERIGTEGTLFIDPTNFNDTDNYIFGKVYRDYSDPLASIRMNLPNVTLPLIEVTDIPSYSAATGKLEWNHLKGYARAERWSQGPPDPIHFNVAIDTVSLHNVLEIPDGFVQGDFKISEDGYLGFDTSDEIIGNTLEITNAQTGNSFTITADSVSADNLWVDWALDTSGGQIVVDDLYFTGALNSFKDFQISMNLQGKNGNFYGDWQMGDSGYFEIDFAQTDNVLLSFNMDDNSDQFDLNGYVKIANNLHYDMSWDWKQGSSLQEPGYFKINDNTNDPNIEEVNLYFTSTPDGYQTPQYGVNITISALSFYMSCEWYKVQGHVLPYVWLQYAISGDLDLHLLWDGDWYLNVEEWPQ